MDNIIILTDEKSSIIRKALYAYLSAGNKEDRKEASKLAKEAYKVISGGDYVNPNNRKVRKTMMEML